MFFQVQGGHLQLPSDLLGESWRDVRRTKISAGICRCSPVIPLAPIAFFQFLTLAAQTDLIVGTQGQTSYDVVGITVELIAQFVQKFLHLTRPVMEILTITNIEDHCLAECGPALASVLHSRQAMPDNN